ncbi:carbohydrate ABC transporter substrate-binding protein (CUT1 family) [Paraburkholderia caballeronis]|nr:carbohydrate ABC transporter substrate-binding protein (CUT1 family) [Paraburkholderia caballeronis]
MWSDSRDAMRRRRFLKTVALAGATATLGGSFARGAFAAESITLRWWSTQSAPDQLKAYRDQIAGFRALHPDIKVVFEPTSDEGYPAQFAAAFAAKQVPDIVTHLPSYAAQTYYADGLVAPMDDVVAKIGADKYYPNANDVFRAADGKLCATGLANTAADVLWIRRDLMQKAGIDKVPQTWDELRAACRKMQGGRIYGAPLPYGLNSMTSLIMLGFIHRAGGQVFTPDLQVAIDSPETLHALDFYKSMRELTPPGATGYSWGESLTAFVSGSTATGIYGGRVLDNIATQNPGIADSVTCATYPTISPSIAPWTYNDFPCVFIPKDAKHIAASKAFAAYLFDPAGYIEELLGAPGHLLPVLKPIAADPRYTGNPIIGKYRTEVDLMANAAAAGHNLGYESPKHKPNRRANEIVASNVLAEMVQRVVLNGDAPKQVVAATAQKLEALMKA